MKRALRILIGASIWSLAAILAAWHFTVPWAAGAAVCGSLQRAKTIIEKRWGQRVPDTGPWLWHNRILWELISVAGNMNHREEQLELLRLHDRLYEPEATASYGWPLMLCS